MENNIKMHERMARLETQMKSVIENHLPHLEKKIDKVVSKQWWLFTTMVGVLVGIIMLLIRSFI